jgi:hypothetical protein
MMTRKFSLALVATLISTGAMAEDSGFLTDYSKLTDGGASGFTRAYIAPGALETIARFNKVMIDQPSFVISPDSKYKGVKPNDIVVVGEELRAAVIDGVRTRFEVVEEPGDGAAVMSWAVTNLRLTKAKRGLLSYTPVGAVAYAGKTVMSDVVEKTRAFDVVFEVEATDSVTGEVLFAMVYDMTKKGEEAQWGDALALANGLGQRVGCRLRNASLAAADREDCLGIPISAAE